MPQNLSTSDLIAEPSIVVRWPDSAQPDVLPLRFFSRRTFLTGQTHRVGSRKNLKGETKCDVSVRGVVAELNYEPYPKFNLGNGRFLDVTRLTFTDEIRTKIVSAEWRAQGKQFLSLLQ